MDVTAMFEAGIIGEDDRIELEQGAIIVMSPIGPAGPTRGRGRPRCHTPRDGGEQNEAGGRRGARRALMPRSDEQLLSTRVAVPEHVVRRSFGEETIALNLESGLYHGINATAAVMLDALAEGTPPAAVATEIAAAAAQPLERVERDLLVLLRALDERGLITLHDDDPG
ncbi:MAG: PqqD family protein [Solirubrobacterales bacterium]|nr:PqqD family protein [Solirubrobacterales bacterium]